jgi:guanylate kinase
MSFGKLFIVSGCSGVGKSTLVRALLQSEECRGLLHKVITYTTRPAREYERDGIDYHFITQQEFKEKIKENFFLEFSTWYDHYYGTPASVIKKLEKGVSFMMVVDRQGTREIVKKYPKAITIWIQAPSFDVLQDRLQERATEDREAIERRIQKAVFEQQEEDAQQFYKYHLINDLFETTLQELITLVREEALCKG